VVYEAIQEKLNRKVALKLLPALVSSTHPEFVTRFQREATAAAKLHHTNIIPIYDFGEVRDGYYYAMELINGQPLSGLIKHLATVDAAKISATSIAAFVSTPHSGMQDEADDNDALPDEPSSGTGSGSAGSKGRGYYRQVAQWMLEVAKAIHYAHVRGMVHRDLKPSNLMLSTDGRAIVLDFGLVKTTSDQSVTATGSLLGTYRYMSPEQVGAKRIKIDARSDVYSLGVTLYELLTFRPAFDAVEQSELLSQVLFKEPAAPRKVSPSVPLDLQTICLTAMEKAPQDRYQTAHAMADDLESYLRDQVIVARPQGLVRRSIKFVRRRRVESIAVTAILCLAMVSALAYYFYDRAQQAWRDELMKDGIAAAWISHDLDAAKPAFRRVLDANPNDYAALVNLANVHKDEYYARGTEQSLDEAIKLLDRAVKVRPERVDAWNAKGVLYQAWNRPSEANAAYEEILRIDEEYYPAWVNLAMLRATQGGIEEAERCAEKGVECSREKKAVMPLRILAAIQLYLGREDTLKTLEAARAASENSDVRTLILQSQYHLTQCDPDSLQNALNLAVTANTLVGSAESTENPAAKRILQARIKQTLALAQLRNEEWEAAVRAAKKALAVNDGCAVSHLVLAIAHGHLGDTAAAQSSLRAAEETWPEALRQAELHVTQDGSSLWFDTAGELRALQAEARQLLEKPPE
ncbi:MAG: protein kinase, partial [Planctomycetota bacterium]